MPDSNPQLRMPHPQRRGVHTSSAHERPLCQAERPTITVTENRVLPPAVAGGVVWRRYFGGQEVGVDTEIGKDRMGLDMNVVGG
ncbi:uncharacterized protein SPSK_10144 [Sporothrix schenckii 1099-18]|uniref:Uncharacterized protein n=1 Tax=Sporothrix schenckii 1099-18 TaxID=1397361 RepID=A0A0F2MA40_SPOSC|nr:uncharacterized protein SPSK_10144 [Sporothrix schenckii 1099-18]KJR85026.1 hypothetical protein SPSK_10144 [Sporothrix schenckii 1099-18]